MGRSSDARSDAAKAKVLIANTKGFFFHNIFSLLFQIMRRCAFHFSSDMKQCIICIPLYLLSVKINLPVLIADFFLPTRLSMTWHMNLATGSNN